MLCVVRITNSLSLADEHCAGMEFHKRAHGGGAILLSVGDVRGTFVFRLWLLLCRLVTADLIHLATTGSDERHRRGNMARVTPRILNAAALMWIS